MDNGWNEWSKHVLLELQRLDKNIESMGSKVDKISTDILTLKIKASFWGACAASIVAIIVSLVQHIINKQS